MRSRITIDLNEENQPIVRVNYLASDDVRDKMVQRFLQGFGGSSTAEVRFQNYNPEYVNSELEIIPMHEKCNFNVENLNIFRGIAQGISKGDFELENWCGGSTLGLSRKGKTSEPLDRDKFNYAGYKEKYDLVNNLYQQVK